MPEIWKTLLTLCLSTTILIYTRSFAIPLVISLFVYTVITESGSWLNARLKVRKVWSTTAAVSIAVIGFTIVLVFVSRSFGQFADGASEYQGRLASSVEQVTRGLESFGVELDAESMRHELEKLPVASTIKTMTGGAVKFLGNVALVCIFLGFLLAGARDDGEQSEITASIRQQVSSYVLMKTAVSLLTGLLVFAVLLLFGVELAFSIAIITIFLNFIPNIGSILATALPVPILWLQFGFGWEFFIILIAVGAIQFVIGNALEPKLIGHSLDIHPIAVLLFLLFWGLVWGLPGMFLAVPMTVAFKIVLSEFDSTRVFAELIAGRADGMLGLKRKKMRKR